MAEISAIILRIIVALLKNHNAEFWEHNSHIPTAQPQVKGITYIEHNRNATEMRKMHIRNSSKVAKTSKNSFTNTAYRYTYVANRHTFRGES